MFSRLITSCLKIFLLIVIISYFYSCTNVPEKIDLNKTYKLDAWITDKAQGKEAEGMIVLDLKPLLTLQITASAKIDYVSFRSCSREEVQEDPRTGLSRKTFSINYRPNEIEMAGNCPVTVSMFNNKNMVAVSFIDFQDSFTTLPATVICEGTTTQSKGVSVCQSRVESIERIRFDTEVMVSPDKGCELDKDRGKEFTFKLGLNYCVYAFVEIKPPHRSHKLSVYGYDSIQIH